MKLVGLHLLQTYQCTFECDHCFVWGSPWQSGAMNLGQIEAILGQAHEYQAIEWIYFEGGEPFLYYATLLRGVQLAAELGFNVGLVTNSYWALSERDALQWLSPFKGLLQDISISSDLYHYDEKISQQAMNARQAAEKLGIPVGFISIAKVSDQDVNQSTGQLPLGESGVIYRGRAVEKLSPQALEKSSWDGFVECPLEDFENPGRVHIDPFGNIHACQGIAIGNLFEVPLKDLWPQHQPEGNPILRPLMKGGPAELVREFNVPHEDTYADACHLCYETRLRLRKQFPDILMPDQMYGVPI